MPKPAEMTVEAYARHRKTEGLAGTHRRAVQLAIENGRLVKSLTSDGKRIADVAVADAEWAANTNHDMIPATGPTSVGDIPPEFQESRARREAAQAALVEIELAEKRGELMVAIDAESRWINALGHCRTKLLAVASRARQRDPALTGAQVELFESLIREALDDLADGGDE